MEEKTTTEEPKISIKKNLNGEYYLDFEIPDKLEKEIEQKVLQVSGAIVYPA